MFNLAASAGIIIGSTTFTLKEIRKLNWRSTDGNTTNQTDYVFVDAEYRSKLRKIRNYKGLNTDSDYFLHIVKIHNRINKYYRCQRGDGLNMYYTDKLKYPATIRKYTNSLKLQEDCDEEATERDKGNWARKQIIKKAAAGVIKKEGKGQRNNWFDQECKEVKQRKNATYKEIIQKHDNIQNVQR